MINFLISLLDVPLDIARRDASCCHDQRFTIQAGGINERADAECVKASTQKETIDNGETNPYDGEMAVCVPHGCTVCDDGV